MRKASRRGRGRKPLFGPHQASGGRSAVDPAPGALGRQDQRVLRLEAELLVAVVQREVDGAAEDEHEVLGGPRYGAAALARRHDQKGGLERMAERRELLPGDSSGQLGSPALRGVS